MGGRSVPVVASVMLHASLAVGLVASAGGGHSRAAASTSVATLELAVDVDTEVPVVVPEPPAQPAAAHADKTDPPPTHSHPYPVAPSHDARPHDPSLHHHEDEALAHPTNDAPAAAAPAPVADDRAALPHFTVASGAGSPVGVHVAAGASGNGASASPASHDGAGDGAGDGVIVAASAVQVSARLVHSVTAAYPVHARADDVEGDVAVEIVVDREGRVASARVLRPAGHGFDEAALSAVRAYRFSPAQREGRAVRVRMPWTVQFRLR